MSGRWVLALGLIALLGSSPAVAQDPMADGYRVDVRDELEVSVYGEAELSGKRVVEEHGIIDVPLVGEVDVTGLTPLEIARRLEEVYGARFLVNPQVTVRVAVYASKEIRVLGAVPKEGSYYITKPMTVLDAIAAAGGISDDDAKEIQITRGDEVIKIRRDDLFASGTDNILLQAHDIVHIPEGLMVYVGGEVAKPGEIPYSEGLTITQAITMAGSFKPTGRRNRVFLLRDGERIEVNVARILRARDADIMLKPGDQVEIPEAVF